MSLSENPVVATPPHQRRITIHIPWPAAERATTSIWAFRHLGAQLYRQLKEHVARGWTEP